MTNVLAVILLAVLSAAAGAMVAWPVARWRGYCDGLGRFRRIDS